MAKATDPASSILELLQGYQVAQVVIAFAELGIPDALDAGAQDTDSVAAVIQADPLATQRLLAVGEAMDLVTCGPDDYRNTTLGQALTTSWDASAGRFARLHGAFYHRWAWLSAAVRTGTPAEESRNEQSHEHWVRDFTLGLYDTARMAAPAVADALEPTIRAFQRPISMVDIGGGHGGYALELAWRHPDLNAVVFDLPPVIAVTDEIIARSGLQGRVTTRAGDFWIDPLGSGYDLALLFGVLVSETRDANLRLLSTVRDAMAPGGFVVVRVPALVDQRAPSLHTALFDLHLLLSAANGSAYGIEDVADWMRTVGLSPIHMVPLSQPASDTLLIGRVNATT